MELLRKPVQKSHELDAGAGGIRQPVDGDACKRSDAHDAGLEPVHPADLALQRLRRAGKAAGLDGFDKGEVFEQLIVHRISIPFSDTKYR